VTINFSFPLPITTPALTGPSIHEIPMVLIVTIGGFGIHSVDGDGMSQRSVYAAFASHSIGLASFGGPATRRKMVIDPTPPLENSISLSLPPLS